MRRRRIHRDVLFHIPTASALLRRDDPSSSGGAENQVLMLARELARRGYRVGIIALDEHGGLRSRVDGVDVIAQRGAASRARVLRTIAYWAQLARTLLANPSDVVVQRCANIHAAPVALLARVFGRRFAFAAAGMRDFDPRPWRPQHWRLFASGVRLADRVIVQTSEQVSPCIEQFRRCPVLIRSIAEPAERQAGHPEAFLWIGRLDVHKRPMAYVELARGMPEAQFRMVAVASAPRDEGMEAAELERIAATIPNLEVLPARRRGGLAQLYDTAVAVVSTSVSEGMPNVFLEGWSRGIPALALNHDPDGVIDRERLGGFARGSAVRLDELAGALWGQRDDRDDLAHRCRLYVAREHALDEVTDRWIEVLGLPTYAPAAMTMPPNPAEDAATPRSASRVRSATEQA